MDTRIKLVGILILTIGGCAPSIYQECQSLQGEDLTNCQIETRIYKDTEIYNLYVTCRSIWARSGRVWAQDHKGYVPRDHRTGVPRHAMDQRFEMKYNGCYVK